MIFRANRKDNGEEVKGCHLVSDDKHYIINCSGVTSTAIALADSIAGFPGYHEIRPETLAMETTIPDKNGNMIFGSIPVNGKMSEGGDEVKVYLGHWIGWQNGKVTWQLEGSVGWCIERSKEKWRYSLNTNDTLEIINPNPAQQEKG